MWRIANILMLSVFLLSCVVQYNDPDGLLWIAIYGTAAVFTGMALAGQYTFLSGWAFVDYVIGAFYVMPAEWEGSILNVEEAREAFGLIICAAWMLVLSIVWARRKYAAKVTATEAPDPRS